MHNDTHICANAVHTHTAKLSFVKIGKETGMVTHTYNFSTWEGEVGGLLQM